MQDNGLFGRAFPNNVTPESELHESGVSKLGYYAAKIHAASIAHHGLGSPHVDSDKSVEEAERLMQSLEKRLNQISNQDEDAAKVHEPKVISLGSGDVLIQVSEIEVEKNGPQVQIDFFKHNRQHEIGEDSLAEDCDKKADWEHLAVVGSNRVSSLDVLLDAVLDARSKLGKFIPKEQ